MMQSNTTDKVEILKEAVSRGDLILLYAPAKTACMLLVESSPDSQTSNPKTSSITVREVKVHYRPKPGYCIVSGPDVYHNEEEDEDASGDDISTETGCDTASLPLSAYVARFPAESEVEYGVNPHGRYANLFYAMFPPLKDGSILIVSA